MAERLLGIETEYAFTALDAAGAPVDRLAALRRLMRLARDRYPSLSDSTGQGLFLGNASRLYIDVPDHPEYSTPECADPWDVVRYAYAGEQIIETLATDLVSRDRRIAETVILRCNVDYGGTGSTWGCHESFLHKKDPNLLPAHILPHLVSRLIYTGAGGFNSRAAHTVEFTLSPRVWHLEHEVSEQSTFARGIFHTKDESLSVEGYHRLHILCGESNCSETAAWLKLGTTALVVALFDGGVEPGSGVQLQSPLTAMQRYASDPHCQITAPTTSGRELRALDIQRHYLSLAEQHVGAPFMPSWAPEVCQRWRAILDQLDHAPSTVSTVLDWAIKRELYRAHASRCGIPWESLSQWNTIVSTLGAAWVRARQSDELTYEAVLGPGSPVGKVVAQLEPQLRQSGLRWEGLGTFLALRKELFEIDARYGQLGGRSIFASLDAAGVLQHRVPGIERVEAAVHEPPAGSRAQARGKLVQQLAGKKDRLVCDWYGISDRRGNIVVDLSDPFGVLADNSLNAAQLELGLEQRLRSGQTSVETPRLPFRRRPPAEPSADLLEVGGDFVAAEHLRREVQEAEQRHGSDSVEVALACNQLGVCLRELGRAAEAEPFQRRALDLDERLRGANHPKVPHRLNNLAIVLVMQGKLDEAKPLLARAWHLKGAGHDVTSARVLWVRLATGMLEGSPTDIFVGQLKTLFEFSELASPGDLSSTWDVEAVLAQLANRLPAPQLDMLGRASTALNDRDAVFDLEALPEWQSQPPVDLTTPWPG